jgi:hypothetical protein
MKERLFMIKKKAKASAQLQYKRLQRLLVKATLSPAEAFAVPIVINNRNRCTYLEGLVHWLQNAGYTNIYILDNDSDYPALLEYYKRTTAKVIYLKQNVGYKALWQIPLFDEIKKGYYVYTDSDLIPGANCPKDVIFRLYQVLSKHKVEKCGPALKIDDLPDHYERKQEVLNVEKKYWSEEIEKNVYGAPIDTTFALYRPFAEGDAEDASAYRVGGDLTFIHLPWYENSANLGPEAKYYKEHVSSSSFWYNRK